MIRAILTAALITAATCAGAHGSKPQIYRNTEFGITLPVPRGAFLCPIPRNEHDHGPVFLLGGVGKQGCRDVEDVEQHRYIEVFAAYNAAYVTKTLPRLLRWGCKDMAKGPCGAPPSNLRLDGLHSLAARVDGRNGWVYILVETQAGKPDIEFDPRVPSVNYSLTLHTRPQNLKGDLRIFRRVLQTIRLSPPAP